MKNKELKEIIDRGESVEVEFKKSFHSFQEVAKTICAFSNTQGGILILGVSDKGKIEGIEGNLDQLQRKIADANSNIHQKPIIKIEVHEIDKSKVIVIIVHKAETSMFHSFEGALYVRIGTTTQKLEGASILDFLRNRQILLFDEGIEYSAKLESLDEDKIKEYLNLRKQDTYLREHDMKDFLISKKLAVSLPDLKIKNAALLFFARDPQFFFPYAQVKLVRFDGLEPVKIISYEEAKGSLPQIINQSTNFVRRYISKEFLIKGIQREDIPMLPEEAIREAIINAIAHRDYFNKNEIQISIFDDRVEVTNPGGLPEGMEKELLGILSIQRNPSIYQLLKDYGFMEGIGSGIAKIRFTMQSANLQMPEFFISKEVFRIILRIKRIEEIELAIKHNLNLRQIKALDYIRVNKRLKTKEYAIMNKISLPSALKDLKKLEKLKLIKKIGSYKGAYFTGV